MLQFEVFDKNGPASDWPLVNASLVGRDDLPVPGRVRFGKGRLVCEKRGNRPAGLSLLFDAGEMGRIMLQTCLLPERARPYNLAVELARHRIKMFIAKSEEWQMFDLSAKHPAMKLWEEARQRFTAAMTSDDPIEADRIARQSLETAIDATERLALAHAQILLHRRFANKPASSATLGVRVWPGRDSAGLRNIVEKEFDVLVLPVNWRELEIREGQYAWEPLDRWMQWAKQQGKPILAGPLIDFSKGAVPDWIYVWQHDYDTCRDMVYDHLERVVHRYKSVVSFWNLGCGLNINDNFEFTADQMIDLTRMASLLVRQSRKGARTMVELAQPFGEHCARRKESITAVAFAERLIQEGVRLDAVGVQMVFGESEAGRLTRDLMQISSLLDQFAPLEMAILVTALGVPSGEVDLDGGCWHTPWSAERQGRWASQAFALAMSKPYIESVVWSELFDHENAMPKCGGLIDAEGRSKPALQRLLGVRRRLRKPLGPLKLPNRADPAAAPHPGQEPDAPSGT